MSESLDHNELNVNKTGNVSNKAIAIIQHRKSLQGIRQSRYCAHFDELNKFYIKFLFLLLLPFSYIPWFVLNFNVVC